MRNVPLTFLLGLTFAVAPAFSQAGPEVFIGYSNLQSEGLPGQNSPSGIFDREFFRDRTTLHGANAALSAFGNSWIALTFDGSFNRRSTTGPQGVERHTDVFYFLGGPTLKISRGNDARVEPFARVLAGGAHTRFEATSTQSAGQGATTTFSFEVSSTDFSAAAGGGLDVRLGDQVKLRVIQIDYAPIFLRNRSINVLGSNGVIIPATLEGKRQDNFRFGIGLVF